jgi:hypothetical protein
MTLEPGSAGTAGSERPPDGGCQPAGERQPAVERPPEGGPLPAVFSEEIRTALRYERGLVVKVLAVLALLAVIVVLRELFLV